MISRLRGTLVAMSDTGVELATEGGVVYEVDVPLTVAGRLPRVGEPVELRTVQVVREDSVSLYGFIDVEERTLFRTLLGASGVGAKVAVAMLSTYAAPRLARALVEKDLPALVQVPGVGKKTAERIVLELAERVEALGFPKGVSREEGPGGGSDAVQALVALGIPFPDADTAVRTAMEEAPDLDTEALIKLALARK